MNKTDIEWTDKSCNPLKLELPDGGRVNACVKISPGCAHCYAETIVRRWWKKAWRKEWGDFPGYIEALFKLGKPVFVEEEMYEVLRLSDRIARGKADPTKNKIFWNDVTDEYLEFWPDEFRDRIWAVRALTPNLIHQVLTKRPERMAEYLGRVVRPQTAPGAQGGSRNVNQYTDEFMASREYVIGEQISLMAGRYADSIAPEGTKRNARVYGDLIDRLYAAGRDSWPLENVWLGVSVENQKAADQRIHHLLRCPAAVHFLSIEPLLDDVYLQRVKCIGAGYLDALDGRGHDGSQEGGEFYKDDSACQPIAWVILGCESRGANAGRFADGFIPAARSIVAQCQAAGVAVFVKQVPIDGRVSHEPMEWPEDLRIREMPKTAEVSAWHG